LEWFSALRRIELSKMNTFSTQVVKIADQGNAKHSSRPGLGLIDGDLMGRPRDMMGLLLLGVGVIGFLIPIIPGIPFLLGAAALLGPNHPRIKPWMKRIQHWHSLIRKHGTQGTSETYLDAGDTTGNSRSGH
jgi:Protein of unknown function (DUF454)